MSPQCRMKRSTAGGSFFLSVVSVITEISDRTGRMSRAKMAALLSGFDAALLRLNDHAVRRGTAFAARGTCRHQRGDDSFQCLKLAELLAEIAEMPLRKLACLATGAAVLHQGQQRANLGNREIKIAAAAD